MALLCLIGTPQHIQITGVFVKQIGIGEEQAFGMSFWCAQACQDLGFAEGLAVVAQIRVCVQQRTHLVKADALDKLDGALSDIAARQLVEQLQGRDACMHLITTCLDPACLSPHARQQYKHFRQHVQSRLLHVPAGCAQTGPLVDGKIECGALLTQRHAMPGISYQHGGSDD